MGEGFGDYFAASFFESRKPPRYRNSVMSWDVRAARGREKADRIILESHFQLDGFTTFARGARAILDADRNLEVGRHGPALKKIFRRRKIGPVWNQRAR